MSAKDVSLMSKDVVALKGFAAGWLTSVAGAPDDGRALHEVSGPRSCLKDGKVLAAVWAATHPEEAAIELEEANGAEMMEQANLWAVLPVLEGAGVVPLVENQSWDVSGIHAGELLPSLSLVLALAAHAGVSVPRDVYVFEGEGDEPKAVPLTPTVVTDPRGTPTLVGKILVNGKDLGQDVVIRAGEEVVIGRLDDEDASESDGDVLIDDSSVSNEHCVVWYDGKVFRVKDDESTHGTLVAQPWSRGLIDLGSRDAPSEADASLWRGSEIFMGDSQLVVMSIESTHYYSDYPLMSGMFGLNLDIVNGATFQGMTTMGVHYPGTSFGSCSDADVPEDVKALGVAHATVPGMASLHAVFHFSNYFGKYMFINYCPYPCAIARVGSLGPTAPAIPIQAGSFAFVEQGDQINVGNVFVFSASIIPPS